LNTSAIRVSRFAIGVALLSLGGLAGAKGPSLWPDNCLTRLDATNAIIDLNIQLLEGNSATLVLERWCGEHQLAAEPRIVAHRIDAAPKQPSAEQLKRLQVADASEVRYRNVELRCGERVLSKADNWYVPARLSAEMNQQLESTDTPFGKVVATLKPVRKIVEMKTIWSALPEGWSCTGFDAATAPDRFLQIPQELFQFRAVLSTSENLPFSEVNEIYQGGLLAYPWRPLAPAPVAPQSCKVPPDSR
jgi:chorismate-pyruvate lyase